MNTLKSAVLVNVAARASTAAIADPPASVRKEQERLEVERIVA